MAVHVPSGRRLGVGVERLRCHCWWLMLVVLSVPGHDKSTAVWGLPNVREILDLTAEEDGSYSLVFATDGVYIAE